ncbi:MAG TPA: DEAD/DEAH box helicase [Gemmatimonadaceae bacterium]|nr:DEAD/DEAH box helicase [Gemmatimonadaceae bacterium]
MNHPAARRRRWVRCPCAAVQASIAHEVLDRSSIPVTIGEIELAPHQRDAAHRLDGVIRRFGGALLADAVGLGKTYVALALASAAPRVVIVAPASLRVMWTQALGRTGVRAAFVSAQRLSHGAPPLERPDLVIVDEAHHFRNPKTRRYAALASLTRRSRVLLLTATPVHNRAGELAAILALFLGERASSLTAAELARCIVRRDDLPPGAWPVPPPRVRAPIVLTLEPEDDLLEEIAALPPPVPPRDGDDGGALLLFSLIRQWSSSHGALAAALRRRLARATALVAALEDGRHPSRAELTAWRFADDSVQLAFPGMVTPESSPDATDLLAQVRSHADAVRRLLGRLAASRAVDAERADTIRSIRAWHRGDKIVAFTQYADTVHALYDYLRTDDCVAALTGQGSVVAGGALSRQAVLRQFAPIASGVRTPAPAHRIDVLLTTDLLSEGVNLQDACVVVHLDLPWTPARLEQRVGRVARPGAAHGQVSVYALAPPATAERVLGVERRLREKLSAAARAVGVAGAILPGLSDLTDAGPQSPARTAEINRSKLDAWIAERVDVGEDAVAVAVRSGGCDALLALVADAGEPILVASLGAGEPTDDPHVVADAIDAIDAATDADSRRGAAAIECALDRVERWLAFRRAAEAAELHLVRGASARRRVLRRVAAIVARAPSHVRPRLVPLAVEARRAASLELGAGGERVLSELADAEMPDEGWLRAVASFGTAQGGEGPRTGGGERPPRIVAAIVVLCDR